MRKLREDSTWNQLTPGQRETLEDWLFEENPGYEKVLARAREEFGVEATMASLGRYYRRRAGERQVKEVVEAQAAADELNGPGITVPRLREAALRACFEITRGSAARDFGCGQGGEGASARAPASPQRAVTTEPTQAADKRAAARLVRRSWSEGGRVFGEKAVWRRCSSVEDPPGVWASQALPFSLPKHCCALPRKAVSFVAPSHTAFSPKTAPLGFFRQALWQARTPAATVKNFCQTNPNLRKCLRQLKLQRFPGRLLWWKCDGW